MPPTSFAMIFNVNYSWCTCFDSRTYCSIEALKSKKRGYSRRWLIKLTQVIKFILIKDSTVPGASFMNDTGANSVNDLAAKVRDDPLFLIKKKEEEKRKELLHNPVKMKQLKQMLQANLEKSKKKKKDKKKKSKREKEGKTKRKQRHVERSDESEEETRKIVKENGKRRSESHRKRRSDSEEDMHKMAKENKKKRNERHRGSDDESEEDVRGRIRANKQKKHVEERKEILNGSHRNHHREIERYLLPSHFYCISLTFNHLRTIYATKIEGEEFYGEAEVRLHIDQKLWYRLKI